MTTFDRRSFVAAGILGAIGLQTRAGFADERDATPPSLGLGFSLYGMKSLEPVEALRSIRETGYDCVELPVMADWPADAARWPGPPRRAFRDALAERRLRLSALMENLPLVGPAVNLAKHAERLKFAFDLSRELVPDSPPPVETILGGNPSRWDMDKLELAERLGEWAKIAAAHQVTIAIKPHVSGAMHRPEHAVWLLEQVASPWIRAAFDYSHYQLQEIPLHDAVRQLARHSVFAHVKEGRGMPGKFQFLLPGEGTIDYVALLKGLMKNGYRGDVVVEVSGQIHAKPDYDPIAAARQSYQALAPAFERAGVKRRSAG